jgi:hypothetical protein
MGKTITVRVDESTYKLFRASAQADRRTLSNWLEFAGVYFAREAPFVSNEEMKTIDTASLQRGLENVKAGKFRRAR